MPESLSCLGMSLPCCCTTSGTDPEKISHTSTGNLPAVSAPYNVVLEKTEKRTAENCTFCADFKSRKIKLYGLPMCSNYGGPADINAYTHTIAISTISYGGSFGSIYPSSTELPVITQQPSQRSFSETTADIEIIPERTIGY